MNTTKTKEDLMTELETSLNNISWHMRVAKAYQSELCLLVIKNELNRAKAAFDSIDNGIYVSEGVIK